MDEVIRHPELAELALLLEVERASDGMFEGVVFPSGSILDELDGSHTIFVAGRPPVGFVVSGPVDDNVHVHQLSVHPGHGRRGIGSALLSAAVRTAPGAVTLTTFEHVPWNAPWYLRQGFEPFPRREWGPALH